LGLSGKPEGIDGSRVEEMVLAGQIEEVALYCESDVLNTYRVWLIYELFRGSITAKGARDKFAILSRLARRPIRICARRLELRTTPTNCLLTGITFDNNFARKNLLRASPGKATAEIFQVRFFHPPPTAKNPPLKKNFPQTETRISID